MNDGIDETLLTIPPESAWWAERRSRFHHAAQVVTGKRVVDVVSASAFGAEIMLAAGARTVVTVERLRARPARTPSVRADLGALPLAAGSAEVVTCFDVLQRVDAPERVVAEVARILGADGVALLSWPNARWERDLGRPASSPAGAAKELDQARDCISTHFRDVRVLGQVVAPDFPVSPLWDHPARRGRTSGVTTALARLPLRTRDRISRLVWNRPFVPGEYDFTFDPDAAGLAHVHLFECRA